MRRRRRGRWLTVALVLLPVLLAGVYAVLVAAPRYGAETRFSVRSSMPQAAAPAGATGLTAAGNGSALAGGFVDGWAVNDFLKSRDCMRQLDRKIDLRGRLAYAGLDPLNRLARDADEDTLYRAYLDAVDPSYNMLEQINVVRVRALSSADAALISNALIEVAQSFVHSMDEKGVADALRVGKQAVDLAQRQDLDALAALAEWRHAHGDIDPAANAAMLLNLAGQIEAELNAARVSLDKIRAMGNPRHPMLRAAEMQVAALTQRLRDVRGRMSGQGDTEASALQSYETLKNAQAFTDANLVTARQNYQQAFTDTLRLQRYLSVIANPVPEIRPGSPDIPILLLEALAAGLVLAFVVNLARGLSGSASHG
ncbi:sugar ABC transporter [Achromobacter aloeverae]